MKILFLCLPLITYLSAASLDSIYNDNAFAQLLHSFRNSHPSSKNLQLQLEAQQNAVDLSRSGLSPQIYGQALINRSSSEYQKNQSGNAISDLSALSLKGQWNLTGLIVNGLNYSANKSLEDGTLYQTKNTQFSNEIHLLRLYLKALAEKASLSSWQRSQVENQKISQDLLAQYQRGLITRRSYLLQSKQSLGNERSVIAAQELLDQTLSELSKLTFIRKEQLFDLLPDSLITPQFHWENKSESAHLRALQKTLEAKASLYSASKWIFLPEIQATGNYGYENRSPFSGSWTETWSIGATLTLPLFYGGSNIAKVSAQRIALRQAQNTLDQAQSDFDIQMQAFQAKLDRATKVWNFHQQEALLAREIYSESTKEFAGGVLDFNDWLNSRITYENSHILYWSEKLNLWNIWLDWFELQGPQVSEAHNAN